MIFMKKKDSYRVTRVNEKDVDANLEQGFYVCDRYGVKVENQPKTSKKKTK